MTGLDAHKKPLMCGLGVRQMVGLDAHEKLLMCGVTLGCLLAAG